jgi:hypothetical protein
MLAPFSNQRYVVASVLTHAIHRCRRRRHSHDPGVVKGKEHDEE